MSTGAKIRLAAVRDAPVISVLAGQLGYPATETEMTGRLRTAIADPDRAVVAAEIDGRVVGCMELAISEAFESGRWSEIRGLIVDENCRSAGVGTALVAFAKQWTREHGLQKLRVRTNETRTRTHGFYECNGFTKTKSQRVYDAVLD